MNPSLAPMLGHLALDRLRPSDVEALIVAKRDAGLSASTVRTIYTVLRAALDVAVRDRLIRRNVAAAISRPAAQRKDAAYLQAEQAQRLLEVIRGDRLEALYRLLLATGLRRGEALALHVPERVKRHPVQVSPLRQPLEPVQDVARV